MMGEKFPDTQAMINARNLAAQQAQSQMISIHNVNAARLEAERHAARGSFTTIPTAAGQTIIRSNTIGYSAPSLSTFRTPNGSPVQQAMSPSPAFQPNVVVNAQQLPASTSKVDESRLFLLGRK